MATLRTAVIGAGYFGKFHAQKYARLPGSDLVAVVDADLHKARTVARPLKAEALSDPSDLLGRVDAVSVVVPTPAHHAVVRWCLENGLHVLVEKPITRTVAEAQDLIAVARDRGRVLQVGHLERFHAASLAMEGVVVRPLFIQCHRIAPFKTRGSDVDVILDQMIHDIDLILHIVRQPVVSVDAIGAPVITATSDIANARLRFANGCVADVTASRVSLKSERKMRIFQPDTYVSIDLMSRRYVVVQKREGEWLPGIPNFDRTERSYPEGDALEMEIAAFLRAIAEGTPPPVTGEDGAAALETALRIEESLRDSARMAGFEI